MTQPGRLHRLHADARRRPRQPPAGRAATSGRASRRRPTRACSRSSSTGPERAQHVAGQEGLLRRQHRRHRRHDDGRRLHDRLPPGARRTSTRSPACGPATTRRTCGRPATSRASPAGTPKIWAQVASEGSRRVPDAEPHDEQGHVEPGLLALRADRRPSSRSSRTRTPTARRTRSPASDDAILYGATVADPGGLPLGHARVPHLLALLQRRPARRSRRPCTSSSGAGTLPAGTVALTVPAGLDGRRRRSRSARSRTRRESTATFTVTPPDDRGRQHELQDLRAPARAARMTGYTDNAVRIVPPVEGRFQRWGKWEEYDSWLDERRAAARPARPLRRRRSRSASGETINVPVVVHNWSTVAAERHGQPDAAGRTSPPTRRRSRTGRSHPARRRRSPSRSPTRTRRCPTDGSRRRSRSSRRTARRRARAART